MLPATKVGTTMAKDLQRWADIAMFTAAPIDAAKGPEVQLLSCNNDPLGTIAAAAKMYKGEYVENLAEITDEERQHYLVDVRKNVLAAPLEFVNFHFIISGVTRGFTHQMVRQRTATYCQESTRFAVKEDVPVGLPPSLVDTMPWSEWMGKCASELFPVADSAHIDWNIVQDYATNQATKEQLWRKDWDNHVETTTLTYNALINSGMPAEDARGLLPTNLLTRINYNTSLRGLLEHSGLRLCSQAQFEWKLVWRKIIQAIRDYGETQYYPLQKRRMFNGESETAEVSSSWQFDELASIFKPICYKTGKCEFMSDGDRYCAIRDRVQDFHSRGVPSKDWNTIKTSEWMDNVEAARISQ